MTYSAIHRASMTRLKYDAFTYPRRIKKMLGAMTRELAWEITVLEGLEVDCYTLLNGLGIETRDQQYYIGYCKRLWRKALDSFDRSVGSTYDLEKTSLKNEYVLRGWNIAILDQLDPIAENWADIKLTGSGIWNKVLIDHLLLREGQYYGNQRKMFWQGDNRFVFYMDNVNWLWNVSTDKGKTWLAVPNVIPGSATVELGNYGSSFSIWYESPYVFYAFCYYVDDVDHDFLLFRRGLVEGTSITWEPEVIVKFKDNMTYKSLKFPYISISSDGEVWIVVSEIILLGGADIMPFVKAFHNPQNDGSGPWTEYTLHTGPVSPSGQWTPTIIPLTANKMYAVYGFIWTNEYPKGRVWNGAWQPEEEISDAYMPYWFGDVTAVAYGDIVHCAFCGNPVVGGAPQLVYTKREGGVWSEEELLLEWPGWGPALAVDPTNGDLQLFIEEWIENAENHDYLSVRKRKASTGKWDTEFKRLTDTLPLLMDEDPNTFYNFSKEVQGCMYPIWEPIDLYYIYLTSLSLEA